MRLLPLTALVLLAAAFAACDGAGSPEGEGSFTVRVGDAEPETRTGAYFGDYVNEESGATFAVSLGARPISTAGSLSEPAIGLVRDGEIPAPGTYPLVAVNPGGEPPEDEFIGVYLDPARYVRDEDPVRSGLFFTGEGSVTIREIDGGRAAGTFTMWAVEFGGDLLPTDVGVEVTGEFEAVHSAAFGDEDAIWR